MNGCNHKNTKSYRKILFCKNCGIVFGSNSNTKTSKLNDESLQVSNFIKKKFFLRYQNFSLNSKLTRNI